MSLTFRWLGVAGIELQAGGQVLAIDPFFTRPTLLQMLRPVRPHTSLVQEKLPACDAVLVTHAHYDHLLDVPSVLQRSDAKVYGSANTCQLLRLLGIPEAQVSQVHPGDQLNIGDFQVEVVPGQHSPLPFGWIFNGPVHPDLRPPLHVWDYRMDVCLGYRLSVMGTSLLVCSAQPHPAQVLFAVAQESREYYQRLFNGVQPTTFIPIHWDNFTRPLHRPLRRLSVPGRLTLQKIILLARQLNPQVNVLIPEIFREYTLA